MNNEIKKSSDQNQGSRWKHFLVVSVIFLLSPFNLANAESALDLESFLSQVKGNHSGLKGSLIGTQSARLRSEEGKLLLSPTAFLEFKRTVDSKLQQTTFLTYDNITTTNFSFGVRKLTTFGLQASLHYDIFSTFYNNAQSLIPVQSGTSGGSFILTSYAVASPVLELTQSLWGNGFGRSTRATQEQLEAGALAAGFQNSYQAKTTLLQAEQAYWRLVLARQVVDVQTEALDRAQKIHEWNSRRARLHLADEADALQSEASVQSRALDLKAAETEVKLASRAFNSMRTIDSDEVTERLVQLKPSLVSSVQPPKRAQYRDDVLAAQQTTRASTAAAAVAIERDSPTLDVFANLSLNGQNGTYPFGNVSDSLAPSFSLNRPTTAIGLRFSAPFDISLAHQTKDGWNQEQTAADLNFARKIFEQDQNWKDLNTQLEESGKQFKLSSKLEEIQKLKLNNERSRLQHGRSTTYQVLLFEQDYLQAQLIRIRNEATILTVLAQMKLFGENL